MGALADLAAWSHSDGIVGLVVVAVVAVIAIGIRPVCRLLSLRARLKVVKAALDQKDVEISGVSALTHEIARLDPDRIRLDIEIDHQSGAASDLEDSLSAVSPSEKGLLRSLISAIMESSPKRRGKKKLDL